MWPAKRRMLALPVAGAVCLLFCIWASAAVGVAIASADHDHAYEVRVPPSHFPADVAALMNFSADPCVGKPASLVSY